MAYALFRNRVPLEPVVVQAKPILFAAHVPNPNTAKPCIVFVLSEGQKLLVGFRRIPGRNDVEPDAPGFKERSPMSLAVCLLEWVFSTGFSIIVFESLFGRVSRVSGLVRGMFKGGWSAATELM